LDVDAALAAPQEPPALVLTPPQPLGQVSSHAVRDEDLEPYAQRSDLSELLKGFLAHTRCEERMAADLRRMIGLEPGRGMPVRAADLGR
jgi:hypothetical protein